MSGPTPVVFVHGVPETAALWDRVGAALGRNWTSLALPGFGSPRPPGFAATKDAYAQWLVEQLDHIGEPVDLVGHDWGGLLTVRLATTFPDRLHSWATDTVIAFHPDYVWHDYARTWQTPGVGEAAMEASRALPVAEGAGLLAAIGVPATDAPWLWQAADRTMHDCILDLYRSAVPNLDHDWGADLGPTAPPGLVLQATVDPFGDRSMADDLADRLGAPVETLEGLGHWWALQDPARGAAALERFWQRVDAA